MEARSRERERESRRLRHIYYSIISVDNLLEAWREFLCRKRSRKDVAEFSLHLTDHIMELHQELSENSYCHGGYVAFKVNDPKPRDIHKASVKDRLVHHALYRVLYPHFDRKFIHDSYSCRIGKGTQRAMNRFREFGRKVSRNHTRTVWVLKCDIRKFFASIDHAVLKNILRKYIEDIDTLWLLDQVIDSYHEGGKVGIGLPLGNLTSQLLVNIYMNKFDQFVKRHLKARYYIRYADDFVILHESRDYLESLLPQMSAFLEMRLRVNLHPKKVTITTLASGVGYLGWVHFPHHRVLRTVTKHRMFRRLENWSSQESVASYLGLLSHGNAYGHEIAIKQIANQGSKTTLKSNRSESVIWNPDFSANLTNKKNSSHG